MIVIVDTSVVLRILFKQKAPLVQWAQWERAYASEIMGVEARRVIDRLRLVQALDDNDVAELQEQLSRIEAALGRISLTRSVLQRASGSFPTAVKTLDALHLASALMLREHEDVQVTFATHDDQQAVAARALGFDCKGA